MRGKIRRFGALFAVLATGLATVSVMAGPAGAATATPSSIDFGFVELGSESAPRTVEFRLEAGERVVSPRQDGTGDGPRSYSGFPIVADNCSGKVGPTTCTITLKFAPEPLNDQLVRSGVLWINLCPRQPVGVEVPECVVGGLTAEDGLDRVRVELRGTTTENPNFTLTSLAITGPQRVTARDTAVFVVALKDDRNNPINGLPITGTGRVPGSDGRTVTPSCSATTRTLPATESRPQLEGAALCALPTYAPGEGRVSVQFEPSTETHGASYATTTFTIDPAGGTAQAQQGLTIEENDEPPALAPPPSSLTTNAAPALAPPPSSVNTSPPATNTSTQAPPMTPLQMAQQTVASFTPSQLAAMTPQQLSGVAASLVSPQQLMSMSITDRLQVAGLIQQLVAASVRGKLAAAGIGV